MAIANGKEVKALYFGGEKFMRYWYGTSVRITKGTRFYDYTDNGMKIDAGNGVSKEFTGTVSQVITLGGNTYARVSSDGLYANYFLVDDLHQNGGVLRRVKNRVVSMLAPLFEREVLA